MIQISTPIVQGYNWKNQLAQAIKQPKELLRLLELPDSYLPGAEKAQQLFPLRVPLSYLNRIKKADPDDPLLRQVLPLDIEEQAVPDFSNDPVGDLDSQVVPGLLHKYQGRALLIASSACGIHCRYCFRRNFPYNESNPLQNQWKDALRYLEEHTEINEIILSGGDPLSLSDARITHIIGELEKISHLKTLRIHTRLPIVIPQRITQDLINTLVHSRFNVVLVTHVNHANEIDEEVAHALNRFRSANIVLLNQSVLLRGVNDSVSALKSLSQSLFEIGVLPYYLHQLDKVNGAAHFAVEDLQAVQLINELRQALPGYLVPKLVQEQAGLGSKTPLI